MKTFSQRVLFVGFGAVARCALPILLRHIAVDPKRITLMDFEPDEKSLAPWVEQGITFVRDRVTKENMGPSPLRDSIRRRCRARSAPAASQSSPP